MEKGKIVKLSIFYSSSLNDNKKVKIKRFDFQIKKDTQKTITFIKDHRELKIRKSDFQVVKSAAFNGLNNNGGFIFGYHIYTTPELVGLHEVLLYDIMKEESISLFNQSLKFKEKINRGFIKS